MPAKSEKQRRFMQAMAHGAKSTLGSKGPSPSVARKFLEHKSGSKDYRGEKNGKRT
jgi:hypothetical protein